ncbi:SDR family NAD(P)-dependent oxidoreductase [Flavobacterium sp.]|uniref:SDR family NAD(P)-dependent oxidoreductase n=1 Tax=Flavobacterium sp. TaxID=239 RepID=UPI0040337426
METKHALITGATSGIGYELAKLFAQDGYSLVLVARSKDNLEVTAKEMEQLNSSIHTHIIPADLFEADAAQKVYDKTTELGITVNILVNDAGQGEWGRFIKTDLKRELDLIQLNISSLVSLTKFYLKEMTARNEGRILQLASSVSKAPSPYLSVYAATKAFVLSFTEALIEELEDTDVTVTALQPDATDTDFFHKAKAENSVTYREKDLYTAEEVAKAGYEGLMQGSRTVVPGFVNKAQAVLNIVMPDSAIAANMHKQMESSMKEDGRLASSHPASQRERSSINEKKDGINGDY